MASKADVVGLLLRQGLISQAQVEKAKQEVERTGLTTEKALEKLGFITEEGIATARSSALGVPFMDLTSYIIDAALIKLIPEPVAKKYNIVPLFKIGNNLTVGMVDPQDILALDYIRKITGLEAIDPVLVTERGLQKALDTYYGLSGSVDEIIGSLDREKSGEEKDRDLTEIAEEAPIIKLVNIMIAQAVKDRASDIHVEPEEKSLRIRNRIDGVLHEAYVFPKNLHRAVASRIKLLSGMDIAESRKPQDGRIRLRIENKDLDIRVSTFPTVHGENIVMRLLDKASVVLGLEELGLSKGSLAGFIELIKKPNGIILVTGPTGSGKTTTLYSALTTVSSMEKNIITIEDPVEYELPLIRQTPVNPKAGITFANGLRAILRQDPDIIMVGEIRDKETAEVAIQASLTGHLVFSTLHTNDAPTSLTRLIDMDIEPFLIASSVIGILAQRLVRKICQDCKEKYVPDVSVLRSIGVKEGQEFYKGRGCNKCRHTGYVGRIGIFEFLIMSEETRRMVEDKKSADQIKEVLIQEGMTTLNADGLGKAEKGITSIEEVLRVTEVE